MRMGKLQYRGRIAEGKTIWIGMSEKTDQEIPMQVGLRMPKQVVLRTHYKSGLQANTHVYIDNRLFYLTAVRDPDGLKIEQVASAIELGGSPAIFIDKQNQQTITRAHVQKNVSYLDDSGRTRFRHRIEVPLIECPRPQPGEKIQISDITYSVIGVVDEEDDGIVRALWCNVEH